QATGNEKIKFIKFDDLNIDARNRRQKENSLCSSVSVKNRPDLEGLEITNHILNNFYNLKIDDKNMGTLF
ncbi:18262_t:CDS:1, partial [Racocetra fulgida]